MLTIGHHTCSNKGGCTYVSQNAPFISYYDEEEEKTPFLGTGYYFWDNDLKRAHWWGRKHYKGEYCILETDLNISDELFFDLVGSRLHQQMLASLVVKFAYYGFERDNWTIGNFVEFLKEMEMSDYPGIFKYKAIRAADIGPKPGLIARFNLKRRESYTDLEPRYIICIIDLKNVHLTNKKVTCL